MWHYSGNIQLWCWFRLCHDINMKKSLSSCSSGERCAFNKDIPSSLKCITQSVYKMHSNIFGSVQIFGLLSEWKKVDFCCLGNWLREKRYYMTQQTGLSHKDGWQHPFQHATIIGTLHENSWVPGWYWFWDPEHFHWVNFIFFVCSEMIWTNITATHRTK